MAEEKIELRFTDVLEAPELPHLKPLDTVAVAGTAPTGCRLELVDGNGSAYAGRPVVGAFSAELPVGGALGEQAVVLTGPDGAELARLPFRLDAETEVNCEGGPYDDVWQAMEAFIKPRHRERTLGGKQVTIYVPWVRDDVHVMKAFKYWEPEVGSFEEHMLDIQTPEGIVYDYIMDPGSGERFNFHVLMAEGAEATQVSYGGRDVPFEGTRVEQSRYADFTLEGPLCGTVKVSYAPAD
ncbi:MAG: hypothetical protein R6X33_17780 [Candidatus Brocadiia bacterium]